MGENMIHKDDEVSNESQYQKDAIESASLASQRMIDNNPLNLLGLGIVAQFNLMKYLIFAFALFTVFSIPIMVLYTDYDALQGRPGVFADSTLGNLGFSSSACYSTTKVLDSMVLFCNSGEFTQAPASFGIVPFDANNKNVCVNGIGATQTCEQFVAPAFLQQYQQK
jgi:hypothetical protein